MTLQSNVQTGCAPPLACTRGAIRWVCTNNPFYVLSAGLFLAGLWVSFGEQANADAIQPEETWALMSWLAGYTLLLAGTAFVLVRFAKVWDDARTVLLLMVLMFLATSVTFDEVLVQTPSRGVACYLMGLGFAVAVSETLLRGIRLVLPAGFRIPYYLILALFFLYPMALTPLVHEQHNELQMWLLFAFAGVAGFVFLTLLPAIRRGAAYVRDNGSPWPWPLYPWTLFGMLALAVPARAFLLCWSMHLPEGGAHGELVFGLFFLVPFGLALVVLLMEMGLESGSGLVMRAAIILAAGLLVLASAGQRAEPVFQEFMAIFRDRLGCTPLFLTWCALAAFYAYAAMRRVPWATGALTAALLGLASYTPASLHLGDFAAPQPMLLLAGAALQLCLGIYRRSPWNCVVAGLVGVYLLWSSSGPLPASYRGIAAFHLALVAVLLVGALFDNAFARWLRAAGAFMIFLACLASVILPMDVAGDLAPWADAYPLLMGGLLLGYGWLLRHPASSAVACLILVGWLGAAGWQGYRLMRQFILGLDYIAGSLALFVLALVISLAKSGVFFRRFDAAARRAAVGIHSYHRILSVSNRSGVPRIVGNLFQSRGACRQTEDWR